MPGRFDLEHWPARPTGISEAELWQGYSGLAEGRNRSWPRPPTTPETIRRSLAASLGEDPGDGAGSRDVDVVVETAGRP
jgi:hypothetical protein